MINYPVDVLNTRWAVLQLSTGEIVARNKIWPVLDGGEIPGQDPDYVYLLQSSTAQPDYDARLYTLQGVETVDEPSNQLNTVWSTIKRPSEEQIAAAENEEAARLGQIVSLAREAIETRLMVGAILQFIVNAQQFPPKVQTMSSTYIAKATKVWQNRDTLNAKLAVIAAGGDVDLDQGWVES